MVYEMGLDVVRNGVVVGHGLSVVRYEVVVSHGLFWKVVHRLEL